MNPLASVATKSDWAYVARQTLIVKKEQSIGLQHN